MELMDPKDVLKTIEGVHDFIAEAAAEKNKYFKNLKCISCGSSVYSEVSAEDMEKVPDGQVLPYGRARCTACRCLFDPTTGIIIERGSIVNAVEPAVTLINPKSF